MGHQVSKQLNTAQISAKTTHTKYRQVGQLPSISDKATVGLVIKYLDLTKFEKMQPSM